MNYLSRKIGIYCKSRSESKRLQREILSNLSPDSVSKFIDNSIIMKDGSVYTFIVSSECAKGRVFHEAYIQSGIDKEIYESIIRPTVKIGYGEIYLIEELEDFYFRHKLADKYYQECQNFEQ